MTGTDTLKVAVFEAMPPEGVAAVDEGLDRHNLASAPLQDVRPLGSFVRDDSGRVIGGAVGRTWGACCELQQFWVDAGMRGQGIGSRLLRAFEAAAAERGCDRFYLTTFSFQAPRLYQAHGYEAAVAIDGFAPGIVKYVMVKDTRRPAAPAA
jgi:GNAT superfamily N-acetyltransferase